MKDDDKWSSAALTIKSISTNPDEIEAILGIKPTRKNYIDDPVSKTNPKNKRKSHYYCCHSSCSSTEPLNKHIEEILYKFKDVNDKLKILAQKDEVSIFCGFSSANGQGGFTLDPELLSRLSEFGLPLSLDLYPPSDVSGAM